MGCADGAMIIELKKKYPDIRYIGYDIDSGAIAKARSTTADQDKVSFIDNPEELLRAVSGIRHSFCQPVIMMNMSSFLHEVYSYCDERQQQEFMDLSARIRPNFITIRDFHLAETEKLQIPNPTVARKVETAFEAIPTVHEEMTRRGPTILKAWQHKYGSVAEKKESLVHLLLTSRYLQQKKEHAEREFNEDYMSVSEPRLQKFEELGYGVKSKERYNTSDFKKAVEERCALTPEEFLELPKTKVKIVLERKSNLGRDRT